MDKKEKHERIKRTLKIVGPIVAAAGLILTIIGMANFFSAFGSDSMPTLFWCAFIGLPLFGFGLTITVTAFRREIAAYNKNESAPVINEFAEDIQPAVQSVTETVRSVSDEREKATCSCPKCGERNEKDAKFCKNCGVPLKKTCPACGKDVGGDAKFCDNCGKKFEQ